MTAHTVEAAMFSDACNEYIKLVFPQAGEAQLADLRTTFYAGAHMAMRFLTDFEEKDVDATKLFDAIFQELKERNDQAEAQMKAMKGR